MTAIAARPSARWPAKPPVCLPRRPCPACGTPAPSVLAVLPSGRRAIIGACAVCGRQEAQPVSDLTQKDRFLDDLRAALVEGLSAPERQRLARMLAQADGEKGASK